MSFLLSHSHKDWFGEKDAKHSKVEQGEWWEPPVLNTGSLQCEQDPWINWIQMRSELEGEDSGCKIDGFMATYISKLKWTRQT